MQIDSGHLQSKQAFYRVLLLINELSVHLKISCRVHLFLRSGTSVLLHQPPPPFLSLVTLLLLTIPCTILQLFVTSSAVSFIMDEESGEDHVSSALRREADCYGETHMHKHVLSISRIRVCTPTQHGLSTSSHTRSHCVLSQTQ